MGRLVKKFVDFKLKFDSRLVKLVKQCPYLYDKEHSDYNNLPVKKMSWNVIAKYLNTTAEICESRWSQITRRFFEECIWVLNMHRESLWLLFHQIDFLNGYIDANCNYISSKAGDGEAMSMNVRV